MKNFTMPQPCFESMYCPEGSAQPSGIGSCPAGYYCPFATKIACPVGTYCPRDGHWDPMPCPPGTFNGMVGIKHCTDCPSGYICPGFGRIQPAICPAGYACTKQSLYTPNVRCPGGFYCPNGTMTSDPFRNDTTLRPYPCRPGTYCLGGVGYDEIRPGDFLYSQNCTEGFYCEIGSNSPKGTGLCPKGFMCPVGTAVPIPTPKGKFAELEGTVSPADCIPGFYAPTIETRVCYPCPPGTSCENDGMSVASICPPGTYRTSLDVDGVPCVACPQGTWSKNWELRELAECIPCPPGTVCPIDAMTNPCSVDDLPAPYRPTNGGESLHVCLAKGNQYYFGVLLEPWIDVNGAGPHFLPSEDGECYYHAQPHGSVLYQRLRDYHGAMFDIQLGQPHQGYGDAEQTPHPDFFGRGSLAIILPTSRKYDPRNNCTSGFFQYNVSLLNENGGVGADQWIPGTCEADVFCYYKETSQAQPCSEGFVCDERTTALTASSFPCREGYVCDFGTTPDVDISASLSQYGQLCPATRYCVKSTGEGQKTRNTCPAGYFCPTGTADPLFGSMADDAVNRGLSHIEANPFLNVTLTKYLGSGDVRMVSEHDYNCFNSVNPKLRNTFFTVPGNNNTEPVVLNAGKLSEKKCARDHEWRLVKDAIARQVCNCMSQIKVVHDVFRLWMCTGENQLEPLGFAHNSGGGGGLEFWRDRPKAESKACDIDNYNLTEQLPPIGTGVPFQVTWTNTKLGATRGA